MLVYGKDCDFWLPQSGAFTTGGRGHNADTENHSAIICSIPATSQAGAELDIVDRMITRSRRLRFEMVRRHCAGELDERAAN